MSTEVCTACDEQIAGKVLWFEASPYHEGCAPSVVPLEDEGDSWSRWNRLGDKMEKEDE